MNDQAASFGKPQPYIADDARLAGFGALFFADSTPEDVRASLVAMLFNRTALLAASCVACLLVAVCAWARTGSPWAVVWIVAYLCVNLARFRMIGHYHRCALEHSLGSADHWARRYMIAGLTSQFLVGLGCVACLATRDPTLEMFSMMVVTGIAGALASRNAGLPRLAVMQLAASLLPIAILAVPVTGNAWFAGITVGIVMYLFVLSSVVVRNYSDLMQMTVTERENGRLLRRFKYLAQHDPLTGLANRPQLLERLRATIAKSRQEAQAAGPGGSSTPSSTALLYMDLDGFKVVNDTMGHTAGDTLLCAVANRLRQMAHDDDVVSRLGGDEFAILRPQASIAEAEALAESLLLAISRAYRFSGQEAHIGVSIGLAMIPDHAQDADMLLQRADMALYVAKGAAGKGRFRMFDRSMEERAMAKSVMEAELRDTLANGDGLLLHYQPIFDFQSGQVSTREALVRWQHPKKGLIRPSEFIPIAEENGLVSPLGEWVLRTACHDALSWPDQARVAVNVSPVQLGRNGRLPDLVAEVLAESGLPPHRLELEVTETALLSDDSATLSQLMQLRQMGVMIALDDFGTGYSSLAHLRNFAFDRIKIDGSFVRDAAQRPHCAAIVRAVADMGKRLGVVTVAEGIETAAQLALVKEEGCTEGQGFLLGLPQTMTDILQQKNRVAPERAQAIGLPAVK